MINTSQTMTDQVQQITDACYADYDVDAIVRDLVYRYGVVNVEEIDAIFFWTTVLHHATS